MSKKIPKKPVTTVKELTDKLQDGVKEVFETGKYKEFLKSISNLYNFSARNILIAKIQNPNIVKLAGYKQWQKDGRQVKKGEHGIKILAPSVKKYKKEIAVVNPKTQKPFLDDKGKAVTETTEYSNMNFIPITVFDVNQTEGKPVPYLGSLLGNVEDFENLKSELIKLSPLPVTFEDIGNNGFYVPAEKIVIKENLPEEATIRTLIHEISHAKLEHTVGINDGDRRLAEVQAESIAYVICQHLGIETEQESFSYIYSWSKDKEIPELLQSLETIKKASQEILSVIDDKFLALEQEQEHPLNQGDIITTKEASGDIITAEEASGDKITLSEKILYNHDIITMQQEAKIYIEHFNGEPIVQIDFSENKALMAGTIYTLSAANATLEGLERDFKDLGYDKTAFSLHFEMDGQIQQYDGRFDIGDGFGTITNHIKSFQEYSANIEKIPSAQEAMNNFIPYLEAHGHLSFVEEIGNSEIAKEGKSSLPSPYGEFLVTAAKENRPLLNQGKPLSKDLSVNSLRETFAKLITTKKPLNAQIESAKTKISSPKENNVRNTEPKRSTPSDKKGR